MYLSRELTDFSLPKLVRNLEDASYYSYSRTRKISNDIKDPIFKQEVEDLEKKYVNSNRKYESVI